jgi:hypothetical protein
MAGEKKSNLRRKPSVTFWLPTPTRNQMLRTVMPNNILRKKERRKKEKK